MAGFGRVWIPKFVLITKSLYNAIKGPGEFLERTLECWRRFDESKQQLMEAPSQGLPDMAKPFQLCDSCLGPSSAAAVTQRSLQAGSSGSDPAWGTAHTPSLLILPKLRLQLQSCVLREHVPSSVLPVSVDPLRPHREAQGLCWLTS